MLPDGSYVNSKTNAAPSAEVLVILFVVAQPSKLPLTATPRTEASVYAVSVNSMTIFALTLCNADGSGNFEKSNAYALPSLALSFKLIVLFALLSVNTLSSKTQLFNVAIRQGILNIDECRELIGQPPLENGLGKTYRVTADTIDITVAKGGRK